MSGEGANLSLQGAQSGINIGVDWPREFYLLLWHDPQLHVACPLRGGKRIMRVQGASYESEKHHLHCHRCWRAERVGECANGELNGHNVEAGNEGDDEPHSSNAAQVGTYGRRNDGQKVGRNGRQERDAFTPPSSRHAPPSSSDDAPQDVIEMWVYRWVHVGPSSSSERALRCTAGAHFLFGHDAISAPARRGVFYHLPRLIGFERKPAGSLRWIGLPNEIRFSASKSPRLRKLRKFQALKTLR